MNKEEKYKELSKILLKRLIILEKNIACLQAQLEKNSQNHIINISIENGDIIPLTQILKILGEKDEILESLLALTEENKKKTLEERIEQFFYMYVES